MFASPGTPVIAVKTVSNARFTLPLTVMYPMPVIPPTNSNASRVMVHTR